MELEAERDSTVDGLPETRNESNHYREQAVEQEPELCVAKSCASVSPARNDICLSYLLIVIARV